MAAAGAAATARAGERRVRMIHRARTSLPASLGRAVLGVLVAATLIGSPLRGRAASRLAAGGGVCVEPIPTSSLWVGSLDPALTTDAEVTQLIYAGLLK